MKRIAFEILQFLPTTFLIWLLYAVLIANSLVVVFLILQSLRRR